MSCSERRQLHRRVLLQHGGPVQRYAALRSTPASPAGTLRLRPSPGVIATTLVAPDSCPGCDGPLVYVEDSDGEAECPERVRGQGPLAAAR